MKKVISIFEQATLVPSNQYQFANFAFEQFNPVQSGVFPHYKEDVNFIVASTTGSGKTAIAEMLLAHEVRERKGKGVYLCPIKSLAQEKIDEWSDPSHHFHDLNISVCTGDYKSTSKDELDDSDIVIATYEALNSKVRNCKSQTNRFLHEIGTLVIDECHSIGSLSRGSHIENGIMKFSQLGKNGRIVGLSATLPNVEEVARWISTLNDKKTYMLESGYRPVPLEVHYEKYSDSGYSYDDKEMAKVRSALRIAQRYPKDKFILFVHTKKTGRMMLEALQNSNIECDYHHADLDKAKRNKIEKRFREDEKLRVIVATSTLASGINTPARRAVILGIHRGLAEVEYCDIIQMLGRAGRPKYDTQGDAYVLLPTKKFDEAKEKVETPTNIKSQMLDSKVLAFHIVSEIHHGNIKTIEDVHNWYNKTLAAFQDQELNEDILDEVLKHLLYSGAVKEENEQFSITPIGTISSMFYFSPFDVSDLHKNLSKLFENKKTEDDYWISMALGNIDSQRLSIMSVAERNEIEEYRKKVVSCPLEKSLTGNKAFLDGAIKAGYCYYTLLQGKTSANVIGLLRNLQVDFERVNEVLSTIDNMTGKWNKKDWFNELGLRMIYGVKGEMVDLCKLPGIGKVKANRLWAMGLKNLQDVSQNVPKIIQALNCSANKAKEIKEDALSLINR